MSCVHDFTSPLLWGYGKTYLVPDWFKRGQVVLQTVLYILQCVFCYAFDVLNSNLYADSFQFFPAEFLLRTAESFTQHSRNMQFLKFNDLICCVPSGIMHHGSVISRPKMAAENRPCKPNCIVYSFHNKKPSLHVYHSLTTIMPITALS